MPKVSFFIYAASHFRLNLLNDLGPVKHQSDRQRFDAELI
jgi:hypothetical protein